MRLKHCFATFLLSFFALVVHAQQLVVGSYNVRFDNPRDTGNLWADRAEVVANLIRFHDFDVLGTQEALKSQLDDISKALPGYARSGAGRDDGKEKGEHSAIFYKKDRFKLLKNGDFWLSETPEKPSMGWDGRCCHRIVSWVYLQDISTKKKFFVFNAHYDHEGKVARTESSKLILKKIAEIAKNEPVILTGDFNGGRESEPYKILAESKVLKDSFEQVKYPYVNNASFNGFGRAGRSNEVIDHIFVSRHFTASKWGLLTDTYHGKFPSDHFPVLVKLKY